MLNMGKKGANADCKISISGHGRDNNFNSASRQEGVLMCPGKEVLISDLSPQN